MNMFQSDKPCIYIHDACVLLDLLEGNLLGPWFQLGYETRTSHLVYHEIIHEEQAAQLHSFVEEGLLILDIIDNHELPLIAQQAKAWRVSMQDVSAAYLAKKYGGILLSGDKRLRKKSTGDGIEVHGILWVLDTLVGEKLLTSLQALKALDAIVAAGGRMPLKECEERRKRWQVD